MDAVNRRLIWTDPVTKFIGVSNDPRRIVGVAADVDDENLVPEPAMTVYHPMEQVVRGLAADQPVERPATLDDIRAEVLAPNRVNALVRELLVQTAYDREGFKVPDAEAVVKTAMTIR